MSKKNINRLYFIALSFYLIAKYTEISTVYYVFPSVASLMRVLRFASYFMILGVSLINISKERTIFIRYVIIIFILIVISVVSKSVTLLFNFIFTFEAKNIENKKLVTFVGVMQSVVVGLIVLGCLRGIVPNWIYYVGGRYRESLGFFYPNRVSSLYFFIVLAICFFLAENITIVHVLVLEILNVLIFNFTNTRMAFYLTTITLLIFYCIKYKKKELKNTTFTRLIYLHSLYIIPIFTILLCLVYSPSNTFLHAINSLVSNRLLMGHNALLKYPITLFGQHIDWVGFGGLGYIYKQLPGEYNAVDCAYVKILLDNGLLILVMSIVGYIMSSYSEFKQGNRRFCLAIVLMSLYCMIEPPYIETGFNPFVWTLSVLLTKKFIIKYRRNHLYLDLKDVRIRNIYVYNNRR